MLHRARLLRELESISSQLFVDLSSELSLARRAWDQAVNDPELQSKLSLLDLSWPAPSWQGPLDKSFAVAPCNTPYQLLAVDGSQIYPDKHQGTSCFLINIGTVELQYGTGKKGSVLQSHPYVFADKIPELEGQSASSVDVVNCKREELELSDGVAYAKTLQESNPAPLLFLSDGSLLFWHLESKDQPLKRYFLDRYCASLVQCKQNGLWIAGYMSLPRHKELLSIVKAVASGFKTTSPESTALDRLSDTALGYFFLPSGTRSTIFRSNHPLVRFYPPDVAPCFFYFNVGSEIVRIEIPAYIAQDETVLNKLCGMILDQVQKGTGFPVGLAEAHEQAVVRGADREFFYYLIDKLGLTHKRMLSMSQKVRKKRSIPV